MGYGVRGAWLRMVDRKGEKASRIELGTRSIVGPGEVISGERQGGGERYAAPVNIRESPLAHMAARGRVDPTELLAGERLRWLYERSAVGGARSLDPEQFGAGAGADPFAERALLARQELAAMQQRLGKVGCRVLELLIHDGRSIKDAAALMSDVHGLTGVRAEGYVTGRFIEALQDLVALWKLEAIGRAQRQAASYKRNSVDIPVRDAIQGSGPISVKGPSHEISVDGLGNAIREERRPKDLGGGQVGGNMPGGGKRR